MEVAFEAGRALPSDLEIQAVEELAQLGYEVRDGLLYPPKDGLPQPQSQSAAFGVTRNVLRFLVDVVWNEATESTAVPDTPWADRMIDKALRDATHPSAAVGEAVTEDIARARKILGAAL